MVNLLISTIFSSLLLSCNPSTTRKDVKNGQNEQSVIKQSAERLRQAYQKLYSAPYTTIYEEEYFAAFPNSFELLNGLFGYSDKEQMEGEFQPAPLYDEANLYIETFFKLNGIEKNKYYKRIIEISINGRWYADGVNYFQHGMKTKLSSDIESFLVLLSMRNEIEIKSFWFFYFDGPHPIKRLPEELQKVKEIDGRIYSLMEIALKEVQQARKE